MTSSALAYRIAQAQAGEDAAQRLMDDLRCAVDPYPAWTRAITAQLAADSAQRAAFYRVLAGVLARGQRG